MTAQNDNTNTSTKVEQMLQEIAAQVHNLTIQVSQWITDVKAYTGENDGGGECTKQCRTPRVPASDVCIQTAPKRRGRPPKTAASLATPTTTNVEGVISAPKRRGRPPKVKTEEEIAAELNAPPKRRGRPPKVATTEGVEVQGVNATPKRRGRPPKVAVTSTPVLSEEDQAWQEVDMDKEESTVPNIPASMPPAFTAGTPPPMPPPAFPPGAPAFPLA